MGSGQVAGDLRSVAIANEVLRSQRLFADLDEKAVSVKAPMPGEFPVKICFRLRATQHDSRPQIGELGAICIAAEMHLDDLAIFASGNPLTRRRINRIRNVPKVAL